MGLIIKTELETNIGSTDCAYVSIESYTVRKNTGQISFAISYYTNEEYVKESLPKYTEDIANILSISNDAKFTPHSVLYLKDKEWIEVSLPQNLKANFSKPIKTPIFDTKEVIKEVTTPYVSFDKEGNEVELLRTTEKKIKEKTKIGEGVKNEIDWSLMNKPLSFAYKILTEELKSIIPNLQIKKA
tara:strand:+ start:404 stop:961 length:558 start_codon:yes stop_codon:yes gene_type:complete